MPDAASQSVFSLRRLTPLGILVVAGVAFVVAGGHRYLTFSALAENRLWLCGLAAHWGFVAAIAYIAAYAAVVALSVPGGAILTIAGGFLFGTWLGGLCAVVGATLGAVCIFLAARAGPRRLGAARRAVLRQARSRISRRRVQLSAGSCVWCRCFRSGSSTSCRRWPACGCGRSCFATFIGIIPGYLRLRQPRQRARQRSSSSPIWRSSSSRACLRPIVGLAVLALIPVWYKRRQRKENA